MCGNPNKIIVYQRKVESFANNTLCLKLKSFAFGEQANAKCCTILHFSYPEIFRKLSELFESAFTFQDSCFVSNCNLPQKSPRTDILEEHYQVLAASTHFSPMSHFYTPKSVRKP